VVKDSEHRAFASRLQAPPVELDRLQLPSVAVHVDLALHRLENIIAIQDSSASNLEDDG
jgi:hypothetical protein